MEIEVVGAMGTEEEGTTSTPRSGRKKKSALLSRLAMKKKENLSDDSDFGSHVSLQDDQKTDSISINNSSTGEHRVGNHPGTGGGIPVTTAGIPGSTGRPSITPRQLKREPALTDEKSSNIDESLKNESEIVSSVNRVPSDSTLQKIRSYNVASDLPEVAVESQFKPQPPRRPSDTKDSSEKRSNGIHSENSGLRRPRNVSGGNDSSDGPSAPQRPSEYNTNKQLNSTDDEYNRIKHGERPNFKLDLSSRDSAESTKESDDADSDLNNTKSELQAEYESILTSTPRAELPLPPSGRPPKRLSPVIGASTPPPMDADISSTGLRTSYKSDMSKTRAERASRATFSSFGQTGTSSDLGSLRSLQTQSSLPLITTKQARERSFLVGSVNKSLLGSEELERCFPDRKIRVFSATWNMCGIQPKDLPNTLNDFLLPETIDYMPDVVTVGSQETCTDRHEWEVRIQETLGPTHVMVHSCQHGTLHLCVFIKRDLVWYCSVPEDACLTTRKAIRTKGCVGISLTIFGTSFLFLTSHFKPADGRLKERVEDYNKTIKNLDLPKRVVVNEFTAKADDVTARFDCVFWGGDMNFRIERPRHIVDTVMNAIAQKEHPNFEDLLMGDELYKARMEGTAFQEFQEGRINFAPTYKFDIGTDNYDTSPTLRIPSYCDRVLFRCRKKHGIVCHFYDSVDSIKISDHRPVYGLYEVDIKPGRDNIPLSGGMFDRNVFMEATARRVKLQDSHKNSEKSSSICSIQ
ncbi:phosphatidylinositol polyphosphate 5-phosphatase type IV-like isoform X2 [Tubulanus polymorphus]|uniref:phosphatidylinositol polyphosphate 5-phosphatase type IV-like isoform X2 n=1 Tax=Tubulanus polymorphus TaxID=672921 RepID=UPI003DA5468E